MEIGQLVWSSVYSQAAETINKYPAISVAIATFTVWYLHRAYVTHQDQKDKGNQVRGAKRFLNSVLSIAGVMSIALHPIIFSRYHQMTASQVVLYATGTTAAIAVSDYLTSSIKCLHHNVAALEANGFSMAKIIAYPLFNLNSTFLAVWFLINVFGLERYDQFNHELDVVKTAPLIVLNLLAEDCIFWYFHRWMHLSDSFAKVHHFHHCCWSSGILSAICDNPIDFQFEFMIPSALIFLSHLLHQNKIATLFSIAISAGWYTVDHDENVRLPHAAKHHAHCLGYYTVYVTRRDNLKQPDAVRKLMTKGYGYAKSKEFGTELTINADP